MKGFSTSGWMTATTLMSILPENLQTSVGDWLKYQRSERNSECIIRTKSVSNALRITASDNGQRFKVHKRLSYTKQIFV